MKYNPFIKGKKIKLKRHFSIFWVELVQDLVGLGNPESVKRPRQTFYVIHGSYIEGKFSIDLQLESRLKE